MQLRRRLRNGITASAMYTYSKSIDDAGLGGGIGGLVAQNWLDLAAERGLSTFDQRHLLNLTAQYSTGVGIGRRNAAWRMARRDDEGLDRHHRHQRRFGPAPLALVYALPPYRIVANTARCGRNILAWTFMRRSPECF